MDGVDWVHLNHITGQQLALGKTVMNFGFNRNRYSTFSSTNISTCNWAVFDGIFVVLYFGLQDHEIRIF